MAVADNILKKFNLFIDAYSYIGQADEIQLPNLALKTEEFRGAGMDAPVDIDVGMEKLESVITLMGFDPDVIGSFGLGTSNASTVQFVARGALEGRDGTISSVVVEMQGIIKKVEMDPWKAGALQKVKYTIGLSYYSYTQGGILVHQIDIPNGVRYVDGDDTLMAINLAIGGGGVLGAVINAIAGAVGL